MATQSINIGLPTESTNYDNLNTILGGLQDNTAKLITPRSIRDAVYTTWESNIFKQTTVGSNNYIGLESETLKNKIYLGKKKLSNTFVMNNTLMSSDIDLFIYNNKSDTNLTQQNLKVGFLAGASSSIYSNPPYIYTNLEGTYNSLEWGIVNPGGASGGGDIVITSNQGNVYLNNLKFPMAGSMSNSLNGKYLQYQNGEVVFTDFTVSATNIISSGTVSITGNPVLLNGYQLEYTNSIPTIFSLGGITAGSTFSKEPLISIIDRLLYPYTAPAIEKFEIPGYPNGTILEFGDYPGVYLGSFGGTNSYGITFSIELRKKTNLITSLSFTNGITSSISLPINGFISGTGYGTYLAGNSTKTWTAYASDGTDTTSRQYTLTHVYPFYYGFTTSNTVGSIDLKNLLNTATYSGTGVYNNKLIQTRSNKTVKYSGEGYLIFAYPMLSGPSGDYLLNIKDPNGFDVTNSFVTTTKSMTFPGFASAKNYRVYISSLYIYPALVNGEYKFNFT